MVNIGDRIRLTLNKGADREGVVTGITGSMLRVRWASDEETTVIPGPGTLTVLGRTAGKASRPGKKAVASKATGTRTLATKKVASKKGPSKKGGATTRASADKKLAAKKAPSKKSSGTTTKSGTTKKVAATKRVPSRRAARKQQ